MFPEVVNWWRWFRYIRHITVSMSLQTKSSIASFGGRLLKLAHSASTTKCEMNFNLFIPAQIKSHSPSSSFPLLIYLAGLTCTGDNCAEKGFFQHAASKQGIAVLYPDTSPRKSIPEKNHISSKSLDGKDADPYWAQAVWESKTKTTAGTLALAQASMSMLRRRLGQKLTTCTAISLRSFQTPSWEIFQRLTGKELV